MGSEGRKMTAWPPGSAASCGCFFEEADEAVDERDVSGLHAEVGIVAEQRQPASEFNPGNSYPQGSSSR